MSAGIGRFAPSPTGPLHRGSLVAALGSYLDARQRGQAWLVRIEDLDPPREVAGAAGRILRQLEAHGLHWDGEVHYQSRRLSAYEEALRRLRDKGLVYRCDCSRSRLKNRLGAAAPAIYPGYCRDRRDVGADAAWRLRVEDRSIGFEDRVRGVWPQNLAAEVGDFVVRRRDGLFAYQLAVVVDDAWQGITDVVRGADLLDNTPRQIWLQTCLDLPTPRYAHLPLAINQAGEKLSKQTHAPALVNTEALRNLIDAWHFLGQQPVQRRDWDDAAGFLRWAVTAWRIERVPRLQAPF